MVVLLVVFVVLSGLGGGAFAVVGAPLNGSPAANLVLIVSGALASTLGVWVLRRPTPLSFSDNAGTDAFGVQQWGAARAGTRDEMVRNGVVFLVLGLCIEALGVFIGTLIHR